MPADEASRPAAVAWHDASKLTAIPPSYKRQAWLAVAALLGFVVAYVGLAGWFLFTAWRLTLGPGRHGSDGMLGFLVAVFAAFLAVFMIKAVFFIQRGQPEGLTELDAEQQPELFAFLHELADKAGAPRPHKVYASARVNASVFYDLSLLNLFLPSRKNLEIGLGLVNVLTLGELRAVLAHEFGHFAQRSMAVGRWVYVAHQIAANMVARRDKLDAFLVGLSGFDVRFAWIGWVLQIVLWSIRSLVATAFQGVLILQRALSREMEMQADLVAVSLTGSDALVHALLKLQAADDSWDRTLGFASGETNKGAPPRDLFAMQQHIMARMGEILNDPLYGRAPPLPTAQVQAHRVFKAELAQPPRMWLSHPLNHEREANAKRTYVPAPIDDRSAWTLFSNAQALREQVSAQLIGKTDASPVEVASSLRSIDEVFDRPSLHSRYRGVYLGRSVVRHASKVSDLYASPGQGVQSLAQVYPDTLVHDIERQRQLERELAQLRALQTGTFQTADSEIRYRGRTLARKQLPAQIQEIEGELEEVRQQLQAHDRLCRATHMAAAREAGQGWEAYLQGLLAVLHYADHAEANIQDLQGVLGHAFRVATAVGKVNDKKLQRLIDVGNELQTSLAKLFIQRRQVKLDVKLLNTLETSSWDDYLGDLGLPPVDRSNVNEWFKVVDSWIGKALGSCGALRRVALDTLLDTESMLARHILEGGPADAAPAPSVVPADPDVLLIGQERKPQDKLDWWARFQLAEGKPAALGRLSVAGGIVASVLLMGGSAGTHHVAVYNGLARTVEVRIGEHRATLAPNSTQTMAVAPTERLHVETRTAEGQLIESFEDVRSDAKQVYNVAGASPLMHWTVIYGSGEPPPEQPLGAKRWFGTAVDVLFTEPPQSVSTRHGESATREVLRGIGHLSVAQQLEALAKHPQDRDHVIGMHARWDSLDSPDLGTWLYLDAQKKPPGTMLAARVAESPNSTLLLRHQQDFAASDEAHRQICAHHVDQAKAHPDDANWAYVAVRCLPEGPAKTKAFVEGHRRWPRHDWFAFAAAYVDVEAGHWENALVKLSEASQALPAMAGAIAEDEARLMRLTQGLQTDLGGLLPQSRDLQFHVMLESAQTADDPRMDAQTRSYAALAQGQFVKGQAFQGPDADASARWLRLAAASDGAPPDIIESAMSLAMSSSIEDASFWAALGLAMRQHQDLRPFEKLLHQTSNGRSIERAAPLQMWRALMAVNQIGPTGLSDMDLDGLMPVQRGLVYSTASTALGNRAPGAWRENAKRLLFATERPYFK